MNKLKGIIKIFVSTALACIICFNQVGFAVNYSIYNEIESATNEEFSASKVYINETFENYPTGAADPVIHMYGAVTKVVDVTDGKGLCIMPSKSNSYSRVTNVDFSDSCIIEAQFEKITDATKAKVGYTHQSRSGIETLVSIDKNGVMDAYGNFVKKFGAADKNVDIALRVHDGRQYDICINGKWVVTNLGLPVNMQTGAVALFKEAGEGELIVDKFRVYLADGIAQFAKKEYNSIKYDAAYVDNDKGDRRFFDSTDLNTKDGAYDYITYYPNGNSIICNRLDYHNPNRENDYIIMEKLSNNANYFEIGLTNMAYKKDNWVETSRRPFSFYVIEGDFKFDEFSYETYLSYIIDNQVASGITVSQLLASVQEGGAIRLSNGNIIGGLVEKGKWFNMKTVLNYKTMTADIYVDDVLIGDGLALNKNMQDLKKVRIQQVANSLTGKLIIDNFSVSGYTNPYVLGEDNRVDIYSDETRERAFLEGTVSFNTNGDLIYANNEKYKMQGKHIFQNNEYYVDYTEISKAYNLDLKLESDKVIGSDISISKEGKVVYNDKDITLEKGIILDEDSFLIPVMEFAKKVLGKYCFYHSKTGVIIIGDKELNMDLSDWDYPSMGNTELKMTVLKDMDFLDWFLTYERPEGPELQKTFVEKMGSLDVHPRIMFTEEKLNNIKKLAETDKDLAWAIKKFLRHADNVLEQEVSGYVYVDPMRMKNNAYYRTMKLAFAYNLTGDKKYFDGAWEEIESIANFPDYSQGLWTSNWIIALGIGYDWLYDALSEEQKQIIENALFREDDGLYKFGKAFYGLMRGRRYSGDEAMIRWTGNIGVVIASANLVAAAAIAEKNPEFCFDVIAQSLRALEYGLALMAPAGGWEEGPIYWNFAMTNASYAMLTMDNVFGTYYGIDNTKGFKNQPNAIAAIIAPSEMLNVMGDGGGDYAPSFTAQIPISYILGDSTLHKLRMDYLIRNQNAPSPEDIIAYTVFDDTEKEMEYLTYIPGTEVVTIREDMEGKSDSLYFSTHFGHSTGYHLHYDTAAFVFDILGERWAEDLGMEAYTLSNFGGWAEQYQYRHRTEGHNTLTINPKYDSGGQEEQKYVAVDRAEGNENGGFVTADMKDMYIETNKCKVGYYIADNMRSATAKFEIDLKDEYDVYWFMHTRADVIIDGNKAYLTKDGKSIFVTFETDAADYELTLMDAVPLPDSPQIPAQNKNEGFRKLAIRLKDKGNVNLTVKMAPMGEGISMADFIKTPMDEWKLPEKVNNNNWSKALDVKLFAHGEEVADIIKVYDEIPSVDVVLSNPNLEYEVVNGKTVDDLFYVKIYSPDKSDYIVYSKRYQQINSKSRIGEYKQIPIQSVTVSTEPQEQNAGVNTIDGDLATRWTAMMLGAEAIFDMGEVVDLDAFAVSFWKGNIRKYYFTVLISEDGIEYTPVYVGNNELIEDSEFTVVDVGRKRARYIKYIGNGNSEAGNAVKNSNPTEFRVLVKK